MGASSFSGIFLLGLIYLGFVSLGLPDGSLGAAWPAMARDLRVPLGLAGAVTIVITVLSGLSGFASGRVIARYSTGTVVLASCAMTGAALVGFARADSLAWIVMAAIPLGLGAGAVDAGLNGYVARHYSGRQMNWLHACWGIGATCGPVIVGWSMETARGWRGGYMALGIAQLTLAVVFLATLRLWSVVPERSFESAAGEGAGGRTPARGADSAAAWFAPAVFSAYSAMEATVGLWTATVLTVSRKFPPETAARCVALYFGAIAVGRLVAGTRVDRWGNRRVVVGGVMLAVAGAAGFVIADAAWSAALALAGIGLGLAPVYPGLMHETPKRFAPGAAQIVIGRQTGAAYLGTALVPPILGWLAERWLEGIPWVVVGGLALLLAGIRRLDRTT